MVSKTARHQFLPRTDRIVSRSVSSRVSRRVSGGRRPRVIRFLRPSAARPAAASGRSVRKMMAPKMATRQNPATPTKAVWTSPGLAGAPASMAGRARIGSPSNAPTSSSEKAVSPPTAVSASNPAVASISNWTAAPAAPPPGTVPETALPVNPAVTTANQPRAPRASRCKAKVQVKEASSAATAAADQAGSSVDKRGQEASTSVRPGSTR